MDTSLGSNSYPTRSTISPKSFFSVLLFQHLLVVPRKPKSLHQAVDCPQYVGVKYGKAGIYASDDCGRRRRVSRQWMIGN